MDRGGVVVCLHMCLSLCVCVRVCACVCVWECESVWESRARVRAYRSHRSDSINQPSGGSGQQFMTTRLTGQGGARRSCLKGHQSPQWIDCLHIGKATAHVVTSDSTSMNLTTLGPWWTLFAEEYKHSHMLKGKVHLERCTVLLSCQRRDYCLCCYLSVQY